MRERYLEAFDAIRIDCLNGDKFKTGKTTPEGLPDPSIFSTEHNREGIQVGTAIATLIRKDVHKPASSVAFRHLWGATKRQQLLETTDADSAVLYQAIKPLLELGLPFTTAIAGERYYKWPELPALLPTSFPGVQTKRDNFLTDIDRDSLTARLRRYFDVKVEDADFFASHPEAGIKTDQYDPKKTRQILQSRGILEANFVPFAFRPFDTRWIYWEPETGLLGRKVASYWPNVFSGNLGLVTQQRPRGEWFPCQVISHLGCLDLLDRSATIFPLLLVEHDAVQPNLPQSLRDFLDARDIKYDAIFYHVAAILHSPSYYIENAGALRMDWPRVPIPSDAKQFAASANLGVKLASLLDPDTPVEGITQGKLSPGFRTLGLPYKRNGKPLEDFDLSLSADWGHVQTSGTGSLLVMPGKGLIDERDYTPSERAALERAGSVFGMPGDAVLALLGRRTLDIHLSADAMWTNVPANVWAYTLGGYQVIKKWLSYREMEILGRPLKAEEVVYVSEMVRRIAAILLLGPALDANYEAVKVSAVEWEDGRPVVPRAN